MEKIYLEGVQSTVNFAVFGPFRLYRILYELEAVNVDSACPVTLASLDPIPGLFDWLIG
jgi:hypothetical protein